MKTTPSLLFATVVSGVVAFSVFTATAAQSTRTDVSTGPAQSNAPVDLAGGKLQIAPPEAVKSSVRKLAGQPVRGANGEKLGTIKDFVIEKKSGAVVYAVVSSGGFLGAGNFLRLIPIHALQPAADGAEGFTVRIARVSWDRSPALIEEAFEAGLITLNTAHQDELAALYGSGRGGLASTYPHPRDAAAVASVPRDTEAELVASPWVRASALRGKDIHATGQEIGEIEDVIIDLDHKSATALVEVEDDVIAGDRDVFVPLTELTLDANTRQGIATTLTRQDFAQLDPSNRRRADANLVPTGRISAGQNPALTPDGTLNSAARSARQALDSIPELARASIRVTPENGMLILRGHVRSEQLKEQAEDAVEQAASGIRLQNYLVVDPR